MRAMVLREFTRTFNIDYKRAKRYLKTFNTTCVVKDSNCIYVLLGHSDFVAFLNNIRPTILREITMAELKELKTDHRSPVMDRDTETVEMFDMDCIDYDGNDIPNYLDIAIQEG